MAEDVRLATGIIRNTEGKSLLLYRPDHMQWQFPGKKTGDVGPPLSAVGEAIYKELNIAVISLHKIGQSAFSQGEITYMSEWFQVKNYEGELPKAPTDTSVYSKWDYFDLSLRNLDRNIDLSPNVVNFRQAYRLGHVLLEG